MADASSPQPGTGQPSIDDYGVIGDCRTLALVSRAGSVDWLCIPRFEGPSLFAALLDTDKGGSFSIRPTADFTTERRYRPGTNVLETTFHTRGGVLRLTDAMTLPRWDARPGELFPDHEILRRAECLDGEVEVELICDPRFRYGRDIPTGKELGNVGIHFDGDAHTVMLRSDIPLHRRDGKPGWTGREALSAGERCYASLTSEFARPAIALRLGDAADRRLDSTADWWQTWLSQCSYDGEYREQVLRSMLTLKLLVFPPSGAIVAAGTTSLPEVAGGVRNWDYRFCWLRDASMTTEVLLHSGFTAEGEAFLGWLLHATRLTRPKLQVLYDVYGRTKHPERNLSHLAGYHGSRPVRVGNGAAGQLQMDVYGEVIRAAWTFVEQGGALDGAEASMLGDLGETLMKWWRRPGNGIWELRGDRHHFTQSLAMCWVGLDCLTRLHDQGAVKLKRPRGEVEEQKDAIRKAIESEGWSDELDSYVAWFGSDHIDASLLLLGIMGYEDPGSDRIRSTLERVDQRLGVRGLLYRYRYDDNLPGQEGAFGICGFWKAELLAQQRRVDEAIRAFDHAASFANDLGLFSEEIDPETGALLGNFPQAFTHIGLVSAANEIARARGKPPEKAAKKPDTTRAQTES